MLYRNRLIESVGEFGRRIVVIGGGLSATAAAQRAYEVDPQSQIIMLYRGVGAIDGTFPSDGIDHILHRFQCGILKIAGAEATQIDPKAHLVVFDYKDLSRTLSYDRLIIATGAKRKTINLPAYEAGSIYRLDKAVDRVSFRNHVAARNIRDAVVLGSGPAALGAVEELKSCNADVVLLTGGRHLEPSTDLDDEHHLEAVLGRHGVSVCRTAVASVDARERVVDDSGSAYRADAIIIDHDWGPDVTLAYDAGVDLAPNGAILTREDMSTNVRHVFAAGACCTTRHRLHQEPRWTLSDWSARKQGLVAGENAAGGNAEFAGMVGTVSLSLFGTTIARTGLLEKEALQQGYVPLAINIDAASLLDASPFVVRLIGDQRTGQLLGVQSSGVCSARVNAVIDVGAACLFTHGPVDRLLEFDLNASPGSVAIPIQRAAELWRERLKVRGENENGISSWLRISPPASIAPRRVQEITIAPQPAKPVRNDSKQNSGWKELTEIALPVRFSDARRWIRGLGIVRRRSQIDDQYAMRLILEHSFPNIPVGAIEVRKARGDMARVYAFLDEPVISVLKQVRILSASEATISEATPALWNSVEVSTVPPVAIGARLRMKIRIRPIGHRRLSDRHNKAEIEDAVDLFALEQIKNPRAERFSVYRTWLDNEIRHAGILTSFNILRDEQHAIWIPRPDGRAVSSKGPDLFVEIKMTVTNSESLRNLLLNGVGACQQFGFGFVRFERERSD